MKFFFTAPWEPIVTRRGDALGLRNVSDSFAELVAPDMSNRTYDGRWVTILAWCLCRSHDTFFASEKTSEITRDNQRIRYAWLRPLELMWVARTIQLAADDWKKRPLSGQRSVKPWIDNASKKDVTFGMTSDQFRAYRQTGMYGGYRVAFRKWPNMTISGDGWTPGKATWKLAKWLDKKLGKRSQPNWAISDSGNLPSIKWGSWRNQEHRWWLNKWPKYAICGTNADQNTLPRPRNEFEQLPESEMLAPMIFGDDPSGTKRRSIAKTIERAGASDHQAICEQIGRSVPDDQPLHLLPAFSRLADAGMVSMELIGKIGKMLGSNPRMKLQEIVSQDGVQSACTELYEAARAWPRDTKIGLRFIESIHQFADAFNDDSPAIILRSLLEHHRQFGGGRRWFVLNGSFVEPCSALSNRSSRYRFRLGALCRLAVQCGVIKKMPDALTPELDDELEDVVDE